MNKFVSFECSMYIYSVCDIGVSIGSHYFFFPKNRNLSVFNARFFLSDIMPPFFRLPGDSSGSLSAEPYDTFHINMSNEVIFLSNIYGTLSVSG